MLKSTRFIFLLVLSTLFLFPFFWMLVSSFKPNEEVLAIPVKIFPKIWQIDAYTNLMNYSEYNFPRYFFGIYYARKDLTEAFNLNNTSNQKAYFQWIGNEIALGNLSNQLFPLLPKKAINDNLKFLSRNS